MHLSDTYFDTQAAALAAAFEYAQKRGYFVDEPQRIWTEHVAYTTTVKYTIPLKVPKTGNFAKKHLQISLYRMDNGCYELTAYLN